MEEAGHGGNKNGNGNGSGNGTGKTKKQQEQQHVLEVHHEVFHRLVQAKKPEVLDPNFDHLLWLHFHRLPARYAIDVSVERAEDVLMHMKLLEQARNPATRLAFDVKIIHVTPDDDDIPGESSRKSIHPLPVFGSSTSNLKQLVRQASQCQLEDPDTDSNIEHLFRPMHEITFASEDKPKVLNKITSLLGDLGLNIQEAHAFSTTDHLSLDVFVVTGWHYEETEQLREALEREIRKIEMQVWQTATQWTPEMDHGETAENPTPTMPDHIKIPSDGTDEWEIDIKLLKFGNKVASGTYGDLYKGSYFSQEVAIKVLKNDRLNENMQQEFGQEVYIMRKVRHKNVVQFIGACTKPPVLCIVTEFMSGGSVYDYLHKRSGVLKLPALLKVSLDISKGMDYLHQHNIIHRDLKTANLLMDEHEVVKVADFGVARVKSSSGVMTAETGTYRWMAPEIIEHKPYDQKADVFSFGIVLWELLTAKIPHEYLTPLQAAIGVVQKSLRPTIPKNTNPKLAELMEKCWQQDPAKRPDFTQIIQDLQLIAKETGVKPEDYHKEKGGIFSILKIGH